MGQNYRFFFNAKKVKSCSMKIYSKFAIINISQLNSLLVICVAMDFIWTTLKVIFSIFNFFAPSDSRFSNSFISAKYCPKKIDPYDWFCGPGSHIG